MRWDAVYCALTAVLLGAFAAPLGTALDLPVAVVIVAAIMVAGWAAGLWLLSHRPQLRPVLRSVLAVNAVAAGCVAVVATTRPWDALSLLLLAVVVEVAGFAVAQGLALRAPATG